MNLITEEEGGAFVETALMLPLIVVFFLCAVDYALVLQRAMVIVDAASVGARYGTVAGNGSDLTGMQSVANSAATGVAGFTATASTYCACSPGASAVACTTTCMGQGTPAKYVKVVTGARIPLLFNLATTPTTMQISGSSTMRVAYGQ